jgi:hypothetical protein
MSRRPLRFKQSDFLRALRAVQKAPGCWGVDILPDGTIRAVPAQPAQIGNPLQQSPGALEPNEWDN